MQLTIQPQDATPQHAHILQCKRIGDMLAMFAIRSAKSSIDGALKAVRRVGYVALIPVYAIVSLTR
jgi:hypothetical protein